MKLLLSDYVAIFKTPPIHRQLVWHNAAFLLVWYDLLWHNILLWENYDSKRTYRLLWDNLASHPTKSSDGEDGVLKLGQGPLYGRWMNQWVRWMSHCRHCRSEIELINTNESPDTRLTADHFHLEQGQMLVCVNGLLSSGKFAYISQPLTHYSCLPCGAAEQCNNTEDEPK